MLINCELAYINVGNEEFMEVHGLASNVASADHQTERKASKLGNLKIRFAKNFVKLQHELGPDHLKVN